MRISSDAVPFYATSRFGIAGWFGYEHFISFLVCFTAFTPQQCPQLSTGVLGLLR